MQKRFKISNRWVGGQDDPCFIIAEAGSNHNRDFETAKKLIDVAKETGVDAVKFQTYSAETLYPKNKEPLRLIGETVKPFDVIKAIELPREWQKPLAQYAKLKGLYFMSTPFDKEAIDQLAPLTPAIKWASPELIDRPLLEYAAKKKKPLIVSTGFYSLQEVKEALQWIKKTGNNQVALLQCTALYPTRPEDVNLRAMLLMQKMFNVPIGLSDHTMSTVIPAAAVAVGARIIEKHFTLSRKSQGPDHPFALEPNELKEMVNNIRNVEKSLGNGIKKPVKKETVKEKLITRGIMATQPIKKGEKLSVKNIITLRTGHGYILPSEFYDVLGKKASKDIAKYQPIAKRDLEKS